MSLTLSTYLPGCLRRMKASAPLTVLVTFSLVGCSSIKTPNVISKISMPEINIAENDPSFRKRLYAGGSFGKSSLKPDTEGTVFTVSNSSSTASQFRLGMDLHNQLSVELDTSVLGTAEFAQANTDVSYTSASINALFYGLTGVQNRSRREGFSGYGRLGYGIVQHGSIVEPFDYSKNNLILGFGGEYGFRNGFALRAEVTRIDSEANVFGLGGIYRFGMAPESIGQVFVNAAKPALGAANTQVAHGGRILNGRAQRGQNNSRGQSASTPSLAASVWKPKASKRDLDGDGVANASDTCADTVHGTTVDNSGCGMFDAVLSDVTFKPGSAWLTPRARGSLDKVSVTLLAFPEARIQVRAHTDSEGPADINLGLSARRAESVVAYFQEKGVAELQLETIGLGESQPIDTNESKEGRKRNRRVELMTLPNIDAQTMIDNDAMLAAISIDKADSAKQSAAKSTVPWRAEPVFPPMSGVKIEPLPKSALVAGLSIGGILRDVQFSDGTATLTAQSKTMLKSVSRQLSQFPKVRVVVMGHTDNQRSVAESKALSQAQAKSVVDHLVSLGIAGERLSAEGFGSSLPVAQNLTDADRARNQRIELRVLD